MMRQRAPRNKAYCLHPLELPLDQAAQQRLIYKCGAHGRFVAQKLLNILASTTCTHKHYDLQPCTNQGKTCSPK
jgi:hypothetical protein